MICWLTLIFSTHVGTDIFSSLGNVCASHEISEMLFYFLTFSTETIFLVLICLLYSLIHRIPLYHRKGGTLVLELKVQVLLSNVSSNQVIFQWTPVNFDFRLDNKLRFWKYLITSVH
jgi:hypothetical protein